MIIEYQDAPEKIKEFCAFLENQIISSWVSGMWTMVQYSIFKDYKNEYRINIFSHSVAFYFNANCDFVGMVNYKE